MLAGTQLKVSKACSDTRPHGTVCAVVMTFNRRERLRKWLLAIEQQTVSPQAIIVVDNGSTDGTREMLASDYPGVHLVVLENNAGPSAAAAAGLDAAYRLGHDWIWIFDDDAYPGPQSLGTAFQVVEQAADDQLGAVWLPFSDFGGWEWRGRKIPVSVTERSHDGTRPFRIDQVDLNMTLIARAVIERVGLPRSDFFIMLWSCEYCLRMAEAGFHIWVAPIPTVHHEHAGSDASGIWRSYYQTRNQLVMALQRRSPRELFWWIVRHTGFVAGTLLKHDRKWERIQLRMRGTWDALRGRMGKVVDPLDFISVTDAS